MGHVQCCQTACACTTDKLHQLPARSACNACSSTQARAAEFHGYVHGTEVARWIQARCDNVFPLSSFEVILIPSQAWPGCPGGRRASAMVKTVVVSRAVPR